MSIAILTWYWKSDRGGGLNTYLVNYVAKLKKVYKKENIHIIFVYGSDEEQIKISKNYIMFIIRLSINLIKVKPKIIHVHEKLEMIIVAAVYRLFFRKTKLLFTFHTEPSSPPSLKKKIIKKIEKIPFQWSLNECSCVTFVSRDLQTKVKSVSGLIIKTNTAITYAGVEEKPISKKLEDKFKSFYGVRENDIIILAQGVTSLTPKAEGTKLLILATKLLKSKYPNIKLLVTGDGKYKQDLINFSITNNIDDSIIFTGYLKQPFVAIKIANIYTHITFAEGLGLAILEAMVMGKPIVASSVGGIPEAIEDGENGILTVLDPNRIADSISRLIEDKNLASKLGENAKKTAKSRFNWDQTVNIFMNYYLYV